MTVEADERTRRVPAGGEFELRAGEVAVLRRLAGQTGTRAGELLGLAVKLIEELPAAELHEAVAELRRRRRWEAACRS